MTDAEKIAKLELLLSKTARVIPGLLLYNTFPNDSNVKDAIEVLRELAAATGDLYYARLLREPIVEHIMREQRL